MSLIHSGVRKTAQTRYMNHNLVPAFILENFSSGFRRGEFHAASLFVDISGFSAMTDALMVHGPHGAEVLANLMRTVFESLIHSVFERGGFISGMAGDAFTAIFSLEDEAANCLSALAAAWEIQEAMEALSICPTVYGQFHLSAKVGLDLGKVSWGILSSSDGRRSAYYFQGSAVDGCAAAEHLAQAGEIILSDGLYERLKERIQVEPVSDHFRLLAIPGPLPPHQSVQLPRPALELQRRFFPEELLTQPQSGEFRQVVNLFVGLPTVRTEAQLERFMQSVFGLQDRYGGLLNRLDFGDKGSNLLLFWGAPLAFENDVQQALNFILDLQTQTSLPIYAGVTYQIAHAGFIGSSLQEDYTPYGRGVNLAARFMSQASRSEIWLDAGTARLAQSDFEIEFLGKLDFKGFEEQQPVYALVERKEAPETEYRTGLAGRRVELERLASFVQPLRDQRYASILTIWGEAGIGKTRLVHEFRGSDLFAEMPALWVICRAEEILRAPLGPFRSPLRFFLEQSEAQSEARNKRNFNRKLDVLVAATQAIDRELADELDRTRSFLGALADLHWPDSLFEQLDAQGRSENTLIALTTLLRALSLQQPLILLIEDAHWLDDDSLHYLLGLERTLTADASKSYPIAVLLTSRREGAPEPLKSAAAHQAIELEGLPAGDLGRLAEILLGGPAAPELFELLAGRSGGNPFFAEQILRYLQEAGRLVRGPQGWRHQGELGKELLPADVNALLVARLDRLPADVKAVVQAAAVLGAEFSQQILSALFQDDELLHQKIAIAEEASIWTPALAQRYLFRHALLRDAAYGMQVRARRQALHALAAEAIERLYAAHLSPHYSELAYHFEMAGRADKARLYFHRAGDMAREYYQNRQAVEYYSRALALTPEDDPESSYVLLMAREALYDLLGEREAQRGDFEALERLLPSFEPEQGWRRAAVTVRRADYLGDTGDFSGSIAAAQEAAALANPKAAAEIAVNAYFIWSDGLFRLGQYEAAARQAEAGLDLSRLSGDRRGETRLLNILGWIAYERKDPTSARVYFEQSLDLARATGDRLSEARPLNNLGILAGSEGDFVAARGFYEQALQIARETGSRSGESLVLGNLGWIAKGLGELAPARAYLEQQLRITREMGEPYQEVYALVNLSSIALSLEDTSGAMAYAGHARILAQETGDRSAEAWSLTCQGHVYSQVGLFPRAAGAYQEALDLRTALGQPNLAVEPRAGLAQSAQARGDLAAARNLVEEILHYLESGGTLEGAEEPLRVYLTCYRVLQAVREQARADEVLATAYSLLEAQANEIGDESGRLAFLEKIPANREILAAWTGRQGGALV